MKTKELLKRALKQPNLFTDAELIYFRMIQTAKKAEKKKYKKATSDYLK